MAGGIDDRCLLPQAAASLQNQIMDKESGRIAVKHVARRGWRQGHRGEILPRFHRTRARSENLTSIRRQKVSLVPGSPSSGSSAWCKLLIKEVDQVLKQGFSPHL